MVTNQVLKEYMQELKVDLISWRADLLGCEETMMRRQIRQDEREQFEARRLQEEMRGEVHQRQRLLEDTFTETQEIKTN